MNSKTTPRRGKRTAPAPGSPITYVDLWEAFMSGVKAAKAHATAADWIFEKAAGAHCKFVHMGKDPEMFITLAANLTGRSRADLRRFVYKANTPGLLRQADERKTP